ncbi:hypothetical protein GCM10009603_27650 [Nocardiopsis exhalans]
MLSRRFITNRAPDRPQTTKRMIRAAVTTPGLTGVLWFDIGGFPVFGVGCYFREAISPAHEAPGQSSAPADC